MTAPGLLDLALRFADTVFAISSRDSTSVTALGGGALSQADSIAAASKSKQIFLVDVTRLIFFKLSINGVVINQLIVTRLRKAIIF
jgi:hypothetical protein